MISNWLYKIKLKTYLILTLSFFGSIDDSFALVNPIDQKMVFASPGTFDQRIYSYDMAVDINDDVHVVYSRPTTTGPDIIGYQRRIGGIWQNETIISNDGLRSSISSHIAIDSNKNVYISYLSDSQQSLYYIKVFNGLVGQKSLVDIGAWNTVMQLDAKSLPIFIREGQSPPWTANNYQLKLVSTNNGGKSWISSFLNLPQVNTYPSLARYRLGDFIYAAGKYNIIYGDNGYQKTILNGKDAKTYTKAYFHDLIYANSTDGVNWQTYPADNSKRLNEMEFWVSLAMDGNKAITGVYQYAEYNNSYNNGTRAHLAQITPSKIQDVYTNTGVTWPATREGAGIGLLVSEPGNYLGAWDFSPDYPYNMKFNATDGNIALARNGTDNLWKEKISIAPYSAEGRVLLRQSNKNNLHILVLGDYLNTKLYYQEFNMLTINASFKANLGFNLILFLPAIIH